MDASLQLALERSAQEASEEEQLLVRALAESAAAATASAARERVLTTGATAHSSSTETGPGAGAGANGATSRTLSMAARARRTGANLGARGIENGIDPAYDLYSYSDVRGVASSSPDIRRWAAADNEEARVDVTAFSARERHAIDALDEHIDSLSLLRPNVHDDGDSSAGAVESADSAA